VLAWCVKEPQCSGERGSQLLVEGCVSRCSTAAYSLQAYFLLMTCIWISAFAFGSQLQRRCLMQCIVCYRDECSAAATANG
jgi:hypothetical protein